LEAQPTVTAIRAMNESRIVRFMGFLGKRELVLADGGTAVALALRAR
jgi:hypothetical protein